MRFVKQRDEKVRLALGLTPPERFDPLAPASPGYVLLHALSGYAFGRSSLLAAEIPALCAALLSDPFSLAGAARSCASSLSAGR